MNLLERVQDRIVGAIIGAGSGGDAFEKAGLALEEAEVRQREGREGLADLELMVDDVGWRTLTPEKWNLPVATIRKIVALSRMMWLLNPLIRRAVSVQELYVWALGYEIKAEDPTVQLVLNDFFEDPKNQGVIGAGWAERERDQRIEGNTFFCFYTNKVTGRARVRIMPFDQVEDIYCNPEDGKETWFYRRIPPLYVPDNPVLPEPGNGGESVLYPDILYTPTSRPASYKNTRIDWSVRVLHVKTGGLSSMKFGLPETFAALNWATAYKKILENFATILAAYARLAMKVTNLAGARGVAAAKSKLNTGITSGITVDKNPPTNTASWAMMSGNTDVSPIKTAHSTTAPDEARALRSMVAAGTDLPEHFFGDSEVGNFATSTTLDRPTELKMVSRQRMWTFVMLQMGQKLVEWSAQAPQGRLRKAGFQAEKGRDPFDGSQLMTVTPPDGVNGGFAITFPTITERDVTERVRAVVNALTLNGRKAEGIVPSRKHAFKLLMVALGEKNADALAEKYYPQDIEQGFVDPADELAIKQEEADAMMLSAENSTKVATPKAQAEP